MDDKYNTEMIEHRLKILIEEGLKDRYSEFESVELLSVDCSDPGLWHIDFEFRPAPYVLKLRIVPHESSRWDWFKPWKWFKKRSKIIE